VPFRERWAARLGGVLAAMIVGAAPAASANRTMGDLAGQLPVMTPRVIDWAEKLAARSLQEGTPLEARFAELARRSGVRNPGRIRLVVVEQIPLPEEPMLKVAAGSVGLAQSSAAGMTLGYAVIVHKGYERDLRLLSHEFRHVAQYEAAGGIRAFLAVHLPQLVEFGYEDSPYEVDARAHEVAAR
jgi:hypothetical protein